MSKSVDGSEQVDHQMVALELCDGFSPHDQARMATLSPACELVGNVEPQLD